MSIHCVHFAASEKRRLQNDALCGYVAGGDSITTSMEECTCPDCRAWLDLDNVPDEEDKSGNPGPL